jgi:glycosyltransferase involved in cell wall biosynthesis
MPNLSAIIITKNKAANIAECLDSIAFCDERIVVDCGSEDDTVRIASERGAHVKYRAWQGFGAQKNFALSVAQGEWVLSLDADDRVSPELGEEIMSVSAKGGADGYEIGRPQAFAHA